ncbi:hypothetical protein KVV02_002691 [Mortierella alpina]|uniref:Uncharacterized protein n=1 Tax=Mortierella alpina TaxID=64518 RepID=A0A9P8D2G8_MORAP|nr:hypothetical protein KVV02_002691 [Mortierella alpina]
MLFNEKTYGGVTSSQTGGRKVDVFVRVYDEALEEMVELGVNEHKPPSASDKILDLQLKKLMRINRSILSRIPETSPQLFFDVHGMPARLYAMTHANMTAFSQEALSNRSKKKLASQSPPLTPQISSAASTPQKKQPASSPKKKWKRKFQLEDEEE